MHLRSQKIEEVAKDARRRFERVRDGAQELEYAGFELKSRHDRRVIQRLEDRVREIYLQKEGEKE